MREPREGLISSTKVVPATGLEPVRCYSLEPESSASANSATRALGIAELYQSDLKRGPLGSPPHRPDTGISRASETDGQESTCANRPRQAKGEGTGKMNQPAAVMARDTDQRDMRAGLIHTKRQLLLGAFVDVKRVAVRDGTLLLGLAEGVAIVIKTVAVFDTVRARRHGDQALPAIAHQRGGDHFDGGAGSSEEDLGLDAVPANGLLLAREGDLDMVEVIGGSGLLQGREIRKDTAATRKQERPTKQGQNSLHHGGSVAKAGRVVKRGNRARNRPGQVAIASSWTACEGGRAVFYV